MSERSGSDWDGYLGGQCPVQGCGRISGYPWYFRARGDSWSLEIADDAALDPECLPVVGFGVNGWEIYSSWGQHVEAGYMEEEVAWKLIIDAFDAFRAGKLTYVKKRT